ncbi:acyltransferase [Hymenobacter sp. 5317J-9]|uniref:acyltransferase family protein n=1 Tax=Hymenobacter sp. 5317J-9 TaxID=2932250 RepID=UPI001FD64DA0|nr:acyltransferase [Hymenobacter sp. 5317J-9]UOQ98429.1 acyltransferase [Hymenobacter sp. 5317J-9]
MPAPRPAVAPTEPAPKLAYIDALRGLAILGVVLVHCVLFGTELHGLNIWVRNLFDVGNRGVQLFFLVSAFTLCRSAEARRGEAHPTRNFLLRRLFRIAPIYWLGVLLYGVAWMPLTGHPSDATPANVLANLTFLNGLSPHWMNHPVPGGWSISVEVWFYALAPWLFASLRTADRAARFVAISIAMAIGGTLLLLPRPLIADATLWWQYLLWCFPSQLPHFGLGILLYRMSGGPAASRRLRRSTWALLAGAGLAVLLTIRPVGGSLHYVFGVLFFGLTWALSRGALRLLVNRVSTFLGTISYCLYLSHFMVLYALERFGVAQLVPATTTASALLGIGVRFCLVLGLGSALSVVLHRWVELPGQRLGAYLIRRLPS